MNKKNRLTNLFFIFSILILLGGVAACDNDSDTSFSEQEQLVRDNFDAADTNGDGVLDENEIEAEILNDFSDMDVDGDGEITENDHDHINDPKYQGIPVTAEERSELMYDMNDDEIVTQSEYVESIKELIVNPIDADDNGEITLDEALNFSLSPN